MLTRHRNGWIISIPIMDERLQKLMELAEMAKRSVLPEGKKYKYFYFYLETVSGILGLRWEGDETLTLGFTDLDRFVLIAMASFKLLWKK